jgi:hypothetical protein
VRYWVMKLIADAIATMDRYRAAVSRGEKKTTGRRYSILSQWLRLDREHTAFAEFISTVDLNQMAHNRSRVDCHTQF